MDLNLIEMTSDETILSHGTDKKYLDGPVPSSKKYLHSTVRSSKKLVDGTSQNGRDAVARSRRGNVVEGETFP